MVEVDFENGPETKELNIKLFDYFYIPDDLESYDEVLDTLELLILTKKDAENIFGQIFEFLGEEEIDAIKIKKCFLLAKRVLANKDFGTKIFETVIGSNHTLFEDFITKNEENLKEEAAVIQTYNELKEVIDDYKQKINEVVVAKPRMSVSVRKSVVNMEKDLNELLKVSESEGRKSQSSSKRNSFIDQSQRKSILEKFKEELEKETQKEEEIIKEEEEVEEKKPVQIEEEVVEEKPVQIEEEVVEEKPVQIEEEVVEEKPVQIEEAIVEEKPVPIEEVEEINTNMTPLIINSVPAKRKTETSGGLIDIDISEVKNEPPVRESIFQSQFENLMKVENFSNSTVKPAPIKNLSTKKLIEDIKFNEEKETEGENIFYNQNKEAVLVTLNLLMKYILQERDQERFNSDLSKFLIVQHFGVITSENLIELLKSIISHYSYSGIPSGLIKFLNNWIIHNTGDVFDSQEIKLNILKLYEMIETKHSEVNFNGKGKVRISELKEILRSEDKEECTKKIRKLAGLPLIGQDNLNYHAEAPILPLFQRDYFDILDWSEEEVARQLTLITSYLFSSIQSKELINSQWTRVDKLVHAPNVTKMIERFNKLSLWVCEEILSYDKGKYRALVVEKFIRLATELKKLNNFNDCFIIITALNSFQIKSLAKTWRRLSFESVKTFKELNNLCSYSGNYAALRAEIEEVEDGPCIPYLGYFLKELAFIEEGPKYIKEPNLINIDKLKKVGKIIENVKSYQVSGYPFKPVFKLAFLSDTCPLTEEELTEISAKLEPKFILAKSKNKLKRWTKTDLNSTALPSIFNSFIQNLNKLKGALSLKDRIRSHFKK